MWGLRHDYIVFDFINYDKYLKKKLFSFYNFLQIVIIQNNSQHFSLNYLMKKSAKKLLSYFDIDVFCYAKSIVPIFNVWDFLITNLNASNVIVVIHIFSLLINYTIHYRLIKIYIYNLLHCLIFRWRHYFESL